MISHLFKLPRHRTYNYRPRHFDPLREEFKQKRKERQAEEILDDEDIEVPIKERMAIKGNYIRNKYAQKKEDKMRVYIRIITVVFLLVAMYMFLDVYSLLFEAK